MRLKVNKTRRYKMFDYNYEDWDNRSIETTDLFDYKMPIPQNVHSKVSNNNSFKWNNDTSSLIKTNLINSTTIQESIKSNETSSVPSIPSPTTAQQSENGTLIITSTTVESINTNLTEATLPPPNIDPDLGFPGKTIHTFDASVSILPTTKNPYLTKIEELVKNKTGYFTASLQVLLENLLNKNMSDTRMLLVSLNAVIIRRKEKGGFGMFNGVPIEAFNSLVQMLVLESLDVMRGHLIYTLYAVKNRKSFLTQSNEIFDLVDTIYKQDDVEHIVVFIKDELAGYPNKTKNRYDIANRAMELFVLYPYTRIKNTGREKLLKRKLDELLSHYVFPGDYPFEKK